MTWTIDRSEEMDPSVVYDILKRHKLLPESVVASASMCNNVGTSGIRFTLTNEEGEHVGDVFVSDIETGETASMDFVPVAKHFRAGYHEEFQEVMAPVLSDLFEEFDVRRVTSSVPESRSRTKRALCVLGFSIEGRMRDAVKLHGKIPEDLRLLGMTKADYEKGIGNGT